MRYTAVTALPYADLELATAQLRALIGSQVIATGVELPPARLGLTVTGPLSAPDGGGQTWYWYRGTLVWPPASNG